MQDLSHRIVEKHVFQEGMSIEAIDEILYLKDVIDFLITLIKTLL